MRQVTSMILAHANIQDPAKTLSIVVVRIPKKAPDVNTAEGAALWFRFCPTTPVGAADAVPSTTSDGCDAVKKSAPHCCEITLCTAGLAANIASSAWNVSKAACVHPVHVRLAGNDVAWPAIWEMASMAFSAERGCPTKLSTSSRVDEAHNVSLDAVLRQAILRMVG